MEYSEWEKAEAEKVGREIKGKQAVLKVVGTGCCGRVRSSKV